MAQAVAETRPREQRPHALGGAIEAIGQNTTDPIARLLLERRALKPLIGLGKGCRTGVFGIAQMPEHPAADNRGEIHSVGEAMRMLLIG
jgi:hypothetical protein